MNLPNKITTFRMVCVVVIDFILLFPWASCGVTMPLVFGAISLEYFISAILFLVASFSDFLDGYLARKYNLVTTYGKFMDPIADKLLIDTVVIIMAINHPTIVPPVVAVIMIARDLLVDALRQVASTKGVVLAANIWGKLKTVVQMVALTLALLLDWPFGLLNLPVSITSIICYVAGVVSLLSGILYFTKNLHVFNDKEAK
ncbi:MAG: CDP-diacylglycerol--glycerol-3-phosphate 3-phosphatidyltransferase [Erysipelotrichaceae bacterium]|nr:CDP-diacylglycerol--glycerol-3-phosphate 3-phosphatidyltransferase [Erysipelotrichaceae bacterium]